MPNALKPAAGIGDEGRGRASVAAYAALACCLLISFVGIANRDAWRSDEPRVAAVALEMSDTGEYVVPHLAGEAFVEKPPFYFAAAAGLIRVFGPWLGEVGAARLTSVLCGLFALLFTYLLARRLSGEREALLAVLVLATTASFVKESHWIRVDVALMLWVCASAWSLAEAYFGGRRWLLLLAGLFAALAFLSKGLVGTAFVGVAWLGLVGPLLWKAGRARSLRSVAPWIVPHLLALTVFACAAGAWVLAFRERAGPELWHEWFFDNHVGRITGSSKLGHTREHGRPLYYLTSILERTLPWTPLWGIWLFRRIREAVRDRNVSPQVLFLTVWVAGSLLLLSLASTKRGVYGLPLLPAFAIMSAGELRTGLSRWTRRGFAVVGAASVALGLFMLLAPLLPFLRQVRGLDPVTSMLLFEYRPAHAVVVLGLVMAAFLWSRRGSDPELGVVGAFAVGFIGLQAVSSAAMDRELNQRETVRSFLAQIPEGDRNRIAAWSLTEGVRGYLYLHGRQTFPTTDAPGFQAILEGRNPDFDGVLVGGDLARLVGPEHPVSVRATVYLDRRGRDPKVRHALTWIDRSPTPSEPPPD